MTYLLIAALVACVCALAAGVVAVIFPPQSELRTGCGVYAGILLSCALAFFVMGLAIR